MAARITALLLLLQVAAATMFATTSCGDDDDPGGCCDDEVARSRDGRGLEVQSGKDSKVEGHKPQD